MFDMMKRGGLVAGSSATLVAAVLGVVGILGDSSAAHAAPATASRIATQQIGYGGQLATNVTGTYSVAIRLYDSNETVLHDETVTVDIQRGKFQASVGSHIDLTPVLRNARTMRVFFQGNLVDTVSVLHATAEEARANPTQFSGRRTLTIPPELPASAVSPQALVGTCSINSFFQSFSAGSWGVNVPACSSGVMVSSGFLPFTSSFTLQALIPSFALNDWSIDFTLGTSATVEVFGICCP